MAALGFAGVFVLGLSAPAQAAATGGSAGTSFLTATAVTTTNPAHASGVTGDYMYWSFSAEAGQQPELTANVTLPASADRHGTQDWTIEVFDGLRRRQPCVAGDQSPVAANEATQIALGCKIRQVRSWAEPSDGAPLPGTYYVRLSTTTLPEQDLGLPVQVDLTLAAPKGDINADQGELSVPLNPVSSPGTVQSAAPTPSASADTSSDGFLGSDLLPDFSSRWIWTAVGGILAALAGVVGFGLTRKR